MRPPLAAAASATGAAGTETTAASVNAAVLVRAASDDVLTSPAKSGSAPPSFVEPTVRHFTPSADADAVTRRLVRLIRSHVGAATVPAVVTFPFPPSALRASYSRVPSPATS